MHPWIEKWWSKRREPSHLLTGRWGERQALRLLRSKHYHLVGKRVRVGRRDEIDLIMRDEQALVFIEVKTRANEKYGRPFSAVGQAKRRCLSRAAVAYMRKRRLQPAFIRFDVVEVVGRSGDRDPVIRHIENAFPLDRSCRLWW